APDRRSERLRAARGASGHLHFEHLPPVLRNLTDSPSCFISSTSFAIVVAAFRGSSRGYS
ncbi:MAG: hypothetical protein ACRDPA_22330, partial [Solirubrobacteraceae bacterium]